MRTSSYHLQYWSLNWLYNCNIIHKWAIVVLRCSLCSNHNPTSTAARSARGVRRHDQPLRILLEQSMRRQSDGFHMIITIYITAEMPHWSFWSQYYSKFNRSDRLQMISAPLQIIHLANGCKQSRHRPIPMKYWSCKLSIIQTCYDKRDKKKKTLNQLQRDVLVTKL